MGPRQSRQQVARQGRRPPAERTPLVAQPPTSRPLGRPSCGPREHRPHHLWSPGPTCCRHPTQCPVHQWQGGADARVRPLFHQPSTQQPRRRGIPSCRSYSSPRLGMRLLVRGRPCQPRALVAQLRLLGRHCRGHARSLLGCEGCLTPPAHRRHRLLKQAPRIHRQPRWRI
jgi:hypothetical protein